MKDLNFNISRSFLILIFAVIQIVFIPDNLIYAAEDFNLTILHTNDVHGRLMPFDYSEKALSVGGISRRATIIGEIKSKNPNVLTLDGGDTVQGSNFYRFFNGIPDVKFTSQIGYDMAVLGNHEFDSGIDALEKLVNSAKFPYISSNIRFNKNKSLDEKVKDYIIKDYNGFKVGIIGVTTNELKTLTNDTSNLKIMDDIETVRKIVKKLDKKVDFIVVLSHIGVDEDKKLAETVPQIDVIVGGHSHTFIYKPIVVSNNDNLTLIVQGGELGVALGKLDLVIKEKKIDKYTYNLIPVTASTKEHESIAKEVSLLVSQLDSMTKKVIGSLATPIDAKKSEVRSALSPAGSLITEAIKSIYPNINIVMQNSGGIRAHRYIKAGPITLADIFELYPFDNTIIIAELSGRDIKSILETSAINLPDSSGAFLQTGGVEYTVDLSEKPQQLSDLKDKILKEGDRVKDIKINGKSIEDNNYYTVAINDFIFNGGDGYTQFKNAKNIVRTNILLRDLIIDYIQKNTPLTLTVKDRINIRDAIKN